MGKPKTALCPRRTGIYGFVDLWMGRPKTALCPRRTGRGAKNVSGGAGNRVGGRRKDRLCCRRGGCCFDCRRRPRTRAGKQGRGGRRCHAGREALNPDCDRRREGALSRRQRPVVQMTAAGAHRQGPCMRPITKATHPGRPIPTTQRTVFSVAPVTSSVVARWA